MLAQDYTRFLSASAGLWRCLGVILIKTDAEGKCRDLCFSATSKAVGRHLHISPGDQSCGALERRASIWHSRCCVDLRPVRVVTQLRKQRRGHGFGLRSNIYRRETLRRLQFVHIRTRARRGMRWVLAKTYVWYNDLRQTVNYSRLQTRPFTYVRAWMRKTRRQLTNLKMAAATSGKRVRTNELKCACAVGRQ